MTKVAGRCLAAGSAGDTARSAGKVAISTPKFMHRARTEHDYLLTTMD